MIGALTLRASQRVAGETVSGGNLVRQRHVQTSFYRKSSELPKLAAWWLNTKTPRREEHRADRNATYSIVSFVPS
jgi:hypothetical protein